MEDVIFFNRIALITSLVVFSLISLVWPMVRHRLTHGEGTGFVIAKVEDPVGKVVGIAITVQSAAVMLWCVAFAVFGAEPLDVWTVFPIEVSILGILCIGVAQLTVMTAQSQMGETWRMCIDEDQKKLVTHGLFRLARNPIYSCTVLLVIGVFLLSPSPWTLWLISNAVVFTSIQARLEEDFLLRTHGDEYKAYARRVGRFLPGIGKLRA